MGWVGNVVEDSVERALDDVSHLSLQVGLFEVLDLVEHGNSSVVEVGLSVELAVGEEVNESSLLDEFVLLVNSVKFNLLFGVSQEIALDHLDGISPLLGELLVLVPRVDVVEHGELWSDQVSEVTQFDVS